MSRPLAALVLALSVAAAQDVEVEKPAPPEGSKGILLETQIRRGQRFTGSNTVSFTLTMKERQGQHETSETETVERTERFLDAVERSETHGVLEIERSYLKLFTKARGADDARPDVYKSPLQGQKVQIMERGHRREIKTAGKGAIDPIVRRTVGMEIDWRDILPEDPVLPGDTWEADAGALSRALGAYLNCGSRSTMRVRFEDVVQKGGAKYAKLYVDWTVEGMRDKNLYTKVSLAGDVLFDLALQRVVSVDLTGGMIVRGAVIGTGVPRIIKGEGQVLVKSSLRVADVEAAPEAPEEGTEEED
ncbi:MAG TPA: hypothetical protein VFY93_11760 [Planctomycetota bacterium]|nr:hypothetical protein [Planctomycetota bacterium]